MICNGREIIKAGYAAGKPVSEIARECDSTPGSVRVMAHNLGLRHRRYLTERVPAHLRDDWRNLVLRKKIPAALVAAMLGVEVRS